ncbi:unnamed protein product [Caenorhabditis angaria]|uniref:Uncharacterized protein n=1 Tax=Caenorhabditis angaria TaxID=860376 RepID=A0A9P1ICM9_9PELO|nr:unnamed protein product [Caenorhabditis angaria]
MADNFLDSNSEDLVQKLDEASFLIKSECLIIEQLAKKLETKYDRNTQVLQYGNTVLDSCRDNKDGFVKEFDKFNEAVEKEIRSNQKILDRKTKKLQKEYENIHNSYKDVSRKMENSSEVAACLDYTLEQVQRNEHILEKLKDNIESVWKLVE